MIEKKEPELEFPLDCHFKVIAEDGKHIEAAVRTALLAQGVTAPLTSGNRSDKGKYITFNVTVTVTSSDQINAIDASLRALPGVKMVL